MRYSVRRPQDQPAVACVLPALPYFEASVLVPISRHFRNQDSHGYQEIFFKRTCISSGSKRFTAILYYGYAFIAAAKEQADSSLFRPLIDLTIEGLHHL
jgi:hypothetical protein